MSKITVQTHANASTEKVWKFYSTPEHVVKWNNASPDWHTPKAENDLKVGGKFLYRMEAKDGSFGFDFGGTYDQVKENEMFAYTMGDGRQVEVIFEPEGEKTKVTVIFDAETENSEDMQQQGWQAILDNFKKYVEAN